MATSITEFYPGKDDREVLELRDEVWGKDHAHTNEAFYSWLFSDTGHGKPSGILVRRNGKLVCFAGLVPRTARNKGTSVRVAHGLDFMASPGLQGLSGLYAFKLVKSWIEHATRSGYDLAICYPNQQSIRLLTSDKLNWKVVASPQLLVLPSPTVHFEEAPSRSVPAALATIGGRVLGTALLALQSRPYEGDGVAPIDIASGTEVLEGLWQQAGLRKCLFSRQATAMQWRYGLHPVYDYRMLSSTRNGGVSGFVVTTQRKVMGVNSELVIDGLWTEGDTETPRRLLAEVTTRARREGIGIAAAIAIAGTDFHAALRRAAFIPVSARLNPKPFHLTAYPLSALGKSCMEATDWHMSWGDTDVV